MNTKDHAVSGNVSTDRALDLALEALEKISMGGDPRWADDVIPAIKQARSAPYVASPRVQEPAIKQGWDVDTLLDKPAAPYVASPRVQDTEAHYKGVIEGVQKLFNDKRPQPAPVPDSLTGQDPETPEYREGWNDCRAFMLNWRNNL